MLQKANHCQRLGETKESNKDKVLKVKMKKSSILTKKWIYLKLGNQSTSKKVLTMIFLS